MVYALVACEGKVGSNHGRHSDAGKVAMRKRKLAEKREAPSSHSYDSPPEATNLHDLC
jgi:hypothetical protein